MFVGQIRKYWDFSLVFYPYFGQIKNPNNKTMQKHLLKAEMKHREPEREDTFDLEQDTEQVLASKFLGCRWLSEKSIRVQQNISFTSVFTVHEKFQMKCVSTQIQRKINCWWVRSNHQIWGICVFHQSSTNRA